MCITKAVRVVARQGVLIGWRCIFAVKPSLVPFLGVTVKLGVREADFLPFLNRHSAQFSVGSVREFCAMV